jgi:hypothetical protein
MNLTEEIKRLRELVKRPDQTMTETQLYDAVPTLCDALELSYRDNEILLRRHGEVCSKLEKVTAVLKWYRDAEYGCGCCTDENPAGPYSAEVLLKEWGVE